MIKINRRNAVNYGDVGSFLEPAFAENEERGKPLRMLAILSLLNLLFWRFTYALRRT